MLVRFVDAKLRFDEKLLSTVFVLKSFTTPLPSVLV